MVHLGHANAISQRDGQGNDEQGGALPASPGSARFIDDFYRCFLRLSCSLKEQPIVLRTGILPESALPPAFGSSGDTRLSAHGRTGFGVGSGDWRPGCIMT